MRRREGQRLSTLDLDYLYARGSLDEADPEQPLDRILRLPSHWRVEGVGSCSERFERASRGAWPVTGVVAGCAQKEW